MGYLRTTSLLVCRYIVSAKKLEINQSCRKADEKPLAKVVTHLSSLSFHLYSCSPIIPANRSSHTMPIAIPTSQPSSAATTSAPAPVVPPAPRNPVRLSVTARDHSQPSAGPSTASSTRVQANSTPSVDASIAPAGGEDAEALKRAAIRKAQLQRRVERWMDKLMEETVDRATFKKSVSAWPRLNANITCY